MSNKLSIRIAQTHEDFDLLRPLSLAFHNESRYSHIPYSFEKRDKLFQKALTHPKQYVLFIAEFKNKPVGFLFCATSEYIVGSDILITTIYSFYVSPEVRNGLIGGKAFIGLLKNVVDWSAKRNASEIQIHVTSGINIKRTDVLMKKSGFRLIGGNYSIPLSSS